MTFVYSISTTLETLQQHVCAFDSQASLQHFYNTGNSATARLTFSASVAVFMRQKDTNKTMSCELSVQASLLKSP
jgi:hypothetical protein